MWNGTLRPMTPDDLRTLKDVFAEVVEDGDTYADEVIPTLPEFETYWCGRGGEQWVAVEENHVVGGYTLRPNHPGRGAHVGTASYVVRRAARGPPVAATQTLQKHPKPLHLLTQTNRADLPETSTNFPSFRRMKECKTDLRDTAVLNCGLWVETFCYLLAARLHRRIPTARRAAKHKKLLPPSRYLSLDRSTLAMIKL